MKGKGKHDDKGKGKGKVKSKGKGVCYEVHDTGKCTNTACPYTHVAAQGQQNSQRLVEPKEAFLKRRQRLVVAHHRQARS